MDEDEGANIINKNSRRKLSIFEHAPIDPYFYLPFSENGKDDDDDDECDNNEQHSDDGEDVIISQIQKEKQPNETLKKKSSSKLNFKSTLMNQNVDEKDEYELSDDEVGLSLLPPTSPESDSNYEGGKIRIVTTTDTPDHSAVHSPSSDQSHVSIPIKENYEYKSFEQSVNSKMSYLTVPNTTNGFLKNDSGTPPKKRTAKQRKKSKYSKMSVQHKPKDVFVELVELKTIIEDADFDEKSYQWKEISRWIKYEQDIDFETDMWSKPYVGALLYQSLLYLKTGLQYGTVLLDAEGESFEFIIDEMIQDFIDSGHMNKENRDQFKNVLFSQYIHHQTFSSAIGRKKSIIADAPSHFKRPSFANIDRIADSKLITSHLNNVAQKSSHDLSIAQHVEITMDHKLHRPDSYVRFHIDHNQNEHNPTMTPLKQRRSTLAMIHNITNSVIHPLKTNKSELNLKGAADETEACLMLVGIVDFLDRPVMAFIRLQTAQHLSDDLVEVQLKIRFLFVLLGPKNAEIDYLEIGRCMGTLMMNKDFHEKVYRASDRRELIDAISRFTNKSLCLVIPAGEYDKDLLLPVIEWIQNHLKKKKKRATIHAKHHRKENSFLAKTANRTEGAEFFDVKSYISETKDLDHEGFDPFKRTRCLFGGLIKEIKNRYSKYPSDIRDGFNIHCLVSLIFVFTVCFAPALTFGGILADKTNNWIGVNEMLIATCLNGVIFGLFSGQPILILGSTGPFLLFEEMLYLFCKYKFCIEFLAARCWVGVWVLLYTLIIVAFEGVFIIHYVTRFSEEIFAFLIACVFLTDAFKRVIKFFVHDPLYKAENYCNYRGFKHDEMRNEHYQSLFIHNVSKTIKVNVTAPLTTPNYTTITTTDRLKPHCEMYDVDYQKLGKTHEHLPEPNVALISFVLFLGTFFIAFGLKKLRRSNFFGSYIRRTVSDVGILISILLMVFLDYFVEKNTGVRTEKLNIPDTIIPTKSSVRQSWYVSPLGSYAPIPLWLPIAAAVPAFLIFIVLFLEVELTGLMLNAEHRKVKKGTGFSLDLLLSALLMAVNGFLGLPWMCAAPVRTLAHWASLSIYSKTHVPGEKPMLAKVKEQRVTNIAVHLLIGVCLLAREFLKKIPICVLFGIFLYFGVVSLSGTQLFERIKLFFIPSKYRPNVPYARAVRPMKRNVFTIIQIIGVVILVTFKSFIKISFLFPIVLVLLIPFRIFILPKFFTPKELEQLDQEHEDTHDNVALDFYELTHLPI